MSVDPVGVGAGEHLRLTVDAGAWLAARSRQHTQSDRDFGRIAARYFYRLPGNRSSLFLNRLTVFMGKLRICPDRIPTMRVTSGPPQRRGRFRRRPRSGSAFAPASDMNVTSSNFTYLPSNFGYSAVKSSWHAAIHSSVTGTAVVERRGADRLEFLAAPADANAQGEATLRQNGRWSREVSRSARPAGAAPPSPTARTAISSSMPR